jgi:hypothetical protein
VYGYAVPATAERVDSWIERRFYRRMVPLELADAETSAPRPYTRVHKPICCLSACLCRDSRECRNHPNEAVWLADHQYSDPDCSARVHTTHGLHVSPLGPPHTTTATLYFISATFLLFRYSRARAEPPENFRGGMRFLSDRNWGKRPRDFTLDFRN